MDKDPNYIASVEKAISEKYGTEAIQNPKGNWDETKEKEYLLQMKEFYQKTKKLEESQEKVDVNGIKVSKNYLIEMLYVHVQFANHSLEEPKMMYV